LSRVLNVTDGVLARGSRVLVLLTTNEERGRLHPAITSPGRCLSVVEFNAFDPTEAGHWLAQDAPTTGPMTLAELYEARDNPKRAGARGVSVTAGQYL
jgi:hypothetical protein